MAMEFFMDYALDGQTIISDGHHLALINGSASRIAPSFQVRGVELHTSEMGFGSSGHSMEIELEALMAPRRISEAKAWQEVFGYGVPGARGLGDRGRGDSVDDLLTIAHRIVSEG